MRRSIGFIVLAMLVIGPERAWALANPGSVFRVQSGGNSEIRTGPRGRLSDGRVVEEWAYYRKMGKTRISQYSCQNAWDIACARACNRSTHDPISRCVRLRRDCRPRYAGGRPHRCREDGNLQVRR